MLQVWFLRFSHDGLKLASGSRDTTVIIWDVSVSCSPCLMLLPLYLMLFFKQSTQFLCYIRVDQTTSGAGMAQWWEHPPPTNVARAWFPDPASNVGWVCWFSTLHREIFSENSSFPSPQKPKFDLIVLIVNFSCSVPNLCSSARRTKHLNEVPFLSFHQL